MGHLSQMSICLYEISTVEKNSSESNARETKQHSKTGRDTTEALITTPTATTEVLLNHHSLHLTIKTEARTATQENTGAHRNSAKNFKCFMQTVPKWVVELGLESLR